MAFVVAMVALGLTVGGLAPVMAAPGDVTITVLSGGIRAAEKNVGRGPEGAVFTATSVSGTNERSESCTVDANSKCVISVPTGRKWKISQTAGATGWYTSPSLGMGTKDTVAAVPYVFYTGDSDGTKAVVNSNITLPQGTNGRAKDPRFDSSDPDKNNWFLGPLMSSLVNPPAPATCGSNIAMVLDQSASMGDNGNRKQALMQAAANAAIKTLTGTPSTLAMYSFSDSAMVAANRKLAQTATTSANEAKLHNFINNLPAPGGVTNWDAGLYQVATDPDVPTRDPVTGKAYDLVLMLTDGNPTSDNSYGDGVGGKRSFFQNVEAGISSANAIKNQGTRVVAIGMGLAGTGSEPNLRSLSGQTKGVDYFLTGTGQNESDLAEVLTKLVSGVCNSQMTIQKQIQDINGNLVPNSELSNDWKFDNTISAGSTIGATATTAVTSGGKNGFTTTPIEIPFGTTPTVTIKETLQPNFVPVSATCKVDGKEVTTTFDTATGAASFQAASNVPMSCLFTNRQLPIPAQVVVTKKWVINGAPAVADGSQPGGYTAKLELTQQGAPVFGTIYDGYAAGNSVDVNESVVVPAGCVNVPSGDIGSHVLLAGLNSYALTNTVDCAPTLQLKKTVSGAATPNTNWVLSGTGAGSATVTNPAGGDTAPKFAVSAGVEYSLSEAAKAGFANSGEFNAGDWSCVTDTGTVTVTKGAAGTATLAGLKAGQNVVCTINNAHADQGVDVTKTVTSNAQNVDGTWTTSYDVKVINKSAVVPGTYDLTDTLKFGAGITVNSASWTGPGAKSGTWADPMKTPTLTLADKAVIGAGATDTYTVSVNSTVPQKVWDDKTNVCNPDKTSNGGFLNTATLTVGGKSTVVADCAPPEKLSFDKSMSGAPVWDAATGHWVVTYALTVTNSSAKTMFYSLKDEPNYASGITVVSSSATKNGVAVGGWALPQPLATGASIAAGTPEAPVKDVYLVSVIADISKITPGSKLECNGKGTGFFNEATLTTGTIDMVDDACAPPPSTKFVHTKTVDAGSVKQGADGRWGITYTVTVKNTGTNGGVYDLDDTLRFGAGMNVGAASWTGDGRSGSWADPGTTTTTVLASGRPLAAGASMVYSVKVSGVMVPKGAIDTIVGKCPADGKNLGAFNNAAGLTFTGVRTEVTACAPPSKPKIVKTALSALPNVNVPGEWNVMYKLTVDNSANTTANYYTLDDEPNFPAGVTIAGVTVSGVPATYAAGKVTVVGTPTEIAGGAKRGYTVAFTVNIAADVAANLPKCKDNGGLKNKAVLSVGQDVDTADACVDVDEVRPTPTKTVISSTQKADGTWDVVYEVKVAQPAKSDDLNPFGVSAEYELTDTLKFGAGITVNSASWTGPGAKSGTWAEPMKNPTTTLAPPAPKTLIAAGVTDTYTVSVNAAVSLDAWDNKTAVCVPGGGSNGGFLNAATLTVGGDSTTVSDCVPPEKLTFDKSMSGDPVWDAATGHWVVTYALTVTNSSAKAQFYDLDDATAYASGISVVSSSATKNGVAVGGWALGQQLANDAPIAAGTPEVPVKDVYLVSVVADVSAITKDSLLVCAGSGTGFFNNATLTTGTIEMIDDACAPPPSTTFVHTKTVDAGSVKQAADGTWGITYTVTVKNTGTNGGVYDLDDTLRFGEGFLVGAASWSGDGRTDVWADPNATPKTVLASARPLAAGASMAYTVTVSGVAVPKGAIDTEAGKCQADLKNPGAFNNAAGLTVAGKTTEVAACAPPSKPKIVKTAIDVVPNVLVPGQWTVSYKLTVDNTANTTSNFYTLVDKPNFTTGTSIVSASVDGAPATVVAGKVTVVRDAKEILVGGKHEYTVAFIVNIADGAAALEKCGIADNGLNNQAILTVGLDELTSEACIQPKEANPSHSKTVVSSTQKADGTWDVVYHVTVVQPAKGELNPFGASAKYNLSDTLKFGGGITVNSAAWAGPADAKGSWAKPMETPKATLATNAVIAAGVTDTYTVSVNSTVTQKAWDDNTTVCNPDKASNGGFLNAATLTVAGNDSTVADCAPPEKLSFDKSMSGDPVWDAATGHWVVTYALTVTNSSAKAMFYDLADATDYASGITVVSSSATKNGVAIADWNLSKQLATGASIAAGTPEAPVKDVYLVSVVADISKVTKDSLLECAGSGTGYFNQATLTTGTIEMIDDACAPPVLPTMTHTKTVDAGSVKQAADGTWGITYTVTVKNTGTVNGVYDLDDTLRYGAGFVVGAAAWAGDGRTGSWADPNATPKTVLASGRPLAAGASMAYTVTVSGVAVPKGAIDAEAGKCQADVKNPGAFNNAAGLTVAGKTTEVTACAPPGAPKIVKTAISAVPNVTVPKEWKVSYKLTVDNTANTTSNFYTLVDEPKFTTGTVVSGVTVDNAKATFAAGKVTVMGTSTEIAAGAKHEYTVVFTVKIAAEATTLAKCAVTDGGLNNKAILTVGPDEKTSEACIDPEDVLPTHTKTVVSTTQKADGTWDVVYAVTVAQPAKGEFNPYGASAEYNLSDTLKFGAGITVNSAAWAGPADAKGSWAKPMEDPKNVLATGAVIAAGVTDTYTVSVNANLTQKAVDSGSMTCNPDQSTPGGFLNAAVLTVAGKDLTAVACSDPAIPVVGKKLLSSNRNADGTWNVTFLLEAKNPSATTSAQFVLKDTTPGLAAGVQAKGNWTAVAVGAGTPAPKTASWAPGTTATVASGSIPPATTFSYQVAIVLDVDITAPVEKCHGVDGTSILNKGEVTSGEFTSSADDCGLIDAYDMGIVKTHKPISGDAVESGKGQIINYQMVVTNHGKYDTHQVLVKDPMPQGLSINIDSLQPTNDWDFTGTTATVLHAKYIGTEGVFTAGMESTITLATTVGDLPRTGAGNTYPDIANTACVSHNKPDDRADNDCSTDLVPVTTPLPKLPHTGMNSGGLMGVGGALALLGGLLVFAGYKRRKKQAELASH
ncbi:VWA domain-containing protein [Arthrobacter sp. GMC3]|uniref:VWA domain-containing protein n=1 Tax=Arthrobacter sp. GMC3 TaxID=2058894 RepID=UPI0015E3123C|nr:VWA domain-containing protein [Arthrobacter sp. GMC3]